MCSVCHGIKVEVRGQLARIIRIELKSPGLATIAFTCQALLRSYLDLLERGAARRGRERECRYAIVNKGRESTNRR